MAPGKTIIIPSLPHLRHHRPGTDLLWADDVARTSSTHIAALTACWRHTRWCRSAAVLSEAIRRSMMQQSAVAFAMYHQGGPDLFAPGGTSVVIVESPRLNQISYGGTNGLSREAVLTCRRTARRCMGTPVAKHVLHETTRGRRENSKSNGTISLQECFAYSLPLLASPVASSARRPVSFLESEHWL